MATLAAPPSFAAAAIPSPVRRRGTSEWRNALFVAPYLIMFVAMLVVPLPGGAIHLGGTPQANAAASADAWRQTLAFLGEHLG